MTDIPVPGVPTPPVASVPPDAMTPYDQVAAQFLAALNAAIAIIPAFEPKHPETVRFVQRYLSFSDKLITSTIAAVEANPELAVVKKFDVQKARANDQFMTAFRTIIDAVDELGSNLKFTWQTRKAETIADCLQMFAIAKGIGRDPSSASVAAHVENMKRDLKRPGRKTAKTDKTPAGKTPAPDPAKPPVTQ
ncbi:MAG TPA: hypothetical protein VNN08_20495 [Thermoanaerobaculia bacterium]|nr:hypothetical protein [Thermoanaerobaculia bacterium]